MWDYTDSQRISKAFSVLWTSDLNDCHFLYQKILCISRADQKSIPFLVCLSCSKVSGVMMSKKEVVNRS
jgi:hypothetical protein